jgi:glycosyltransferase involved in cell wall biosynthesis
MATRIGEAEGNRPRIIVDCTHTFHTGAFTGIQRVVRHFADGLLAAGPGRGFDVVPVRVSGSRLLPLPVRDGHVDFPRAASARESHPAAQHDLLPRLRGLGNRLNANRSRALSRWLNAGPNAPGLARLVARPPETDAALPAVAPRRGDILLSLDSSWVYPIRDALDAAGRAGALRVAMLCDVLPLTNPEWFTGGTRDYFHGWLRALLPRLDGLLTISQATADALRAVVARGMLGARTMPPTVPVHLGADLDPTGDDGVRPALKALVGPGKPPAFVSVGTLEPRKNYGYALDIFDALAARGLDFQWHFAGAPGWLAEETLARIRSHPAFGSQLHWWTDLRDTELAWLYRHGSALVALSKAEGFGLPLVEARRLGMPVFASDLPVFREVLHGEARYLPLGCAALAAALLEDFLTGATPAAAGRETPSRAARTWAERTGELLAALESLRR